MPAEFDDYAARYSELLRDPIRERFAPGSNFFMERKWVLLASVLARRGWRLDQRRWLDVGCGQGDLLKLGASRFAAVSGCDVSGEMLAGAQGLDVRIQPSATALPYSDRSFDLVTAVCVYHHVGEDAMRLELTSEIRRVLRPGGIFSIMEHNPWNPATRLIVSRTPVDADARLLTARESSALMRSAGFDVFDREYFLYLPEGLYRRAALLEGALKKVPLGGQYAIFGELLS